MTRLRKKLSALWRRRKLDQDLDDELRFHLEMSAELHMQPEAKRRFGNAASIRERCRDLWAFGRLETWWQDVRYAARNFRRNPGFAAVAVTALALGIGADTAMFTIVKGVLTWDLGVDHVERVMVVSATEATRSEDFGASYPDFQDLRARVKTFSGLAAYTFDPANVSDGSGLPERYNCVHVSANGNQVARQKPILGRDFMPDDEKPGAPAVVILGHHVWQQRYGGDRNVLNHVIRVNEVPMQVIGVMPVGKRFPEETDLWTPLVPTPALERRDARGLLIYGRLADGVSPAAARTELEGLAHSLSVQYPETNRGMTVNVRSIEVITGVYFLRPVFAMLFAAVGFVLLIACADVANMLLARAASRAREISVRVAIGAGRARIVRQLLIESTLLSLAGGVLGWLVALGGLHWFDVGTGDLGKPVWLKLHLDGGAFLYLAAISIGTGILFGLAPALRLSKVDIHGSLKDGGHGVVSGRHSQRLAAGLVAFEMALCVILLAGAGLMIRSASKQYATPIGVDTSNTLTMRINLPEAKYPRPADMVAFHAQLEERLLALPGVTSAAVVSNLPLGGWEQFFYELEGAAPTDRRPRLSAIVAAPDYFEVGRVKPRRGRLLTNADAVTNAPVAVVSASFAARMWPGQEAVGKRLRLVRNRAPQAWLTVVGVVPDVLQDFQRLLEHEPLVYLPFQMAPQRVAFLEARTTVDPVALSSAFRTEVQHLDQNLPLYQVRSLERYISEKRLSVVLFGGICTVFASIALVLASIGLYSVTSHSVSQRMREFGIRAALGGTAADIRRLVFRQSLRPLLLGLVIGLPLAMVVARAARAGLSGVGPGDPITFIGAALVLLAAGVAGCAVPARRAIRVDPVVVLRCD